MPAAPPRSTARPGISLGLRLGTVFYHPVDPRIEFHVARELDDGTAPDAAVAGDIQSRLWGHSTHATLQPRIVRDENGLSSIHTPSFRDAVKAIKEHDTVLLHRPTTWLSTKHIHKLFQEMTKIAERHRRLYVTVEPEALVRLGWIPSVPWRTYIDGGDARIQCWVTDHGALVQPMIEQVLGIGHQVVIQGLCESGVACLGFRLDPDTNEIVPHPVRDFERAFDASGVVVVVSLLDAVGDRQANRLLDIFRSTPRRKQRLYLIDVTNASLGLLQAATPLPGGLVPAAQAQLVTYPKTVSWWQKLRARFPRKKKKQIVVAPPAAGKPSLRERWRKIKPTAATIMLYAALALTVAILALLLTVRW